MMIQPGFDYKTAELREFIHGINPDTVINSRLAEHGDYETPEQFIPVFPPRGSWELCMTTNNTWSYTGREENYKTPYDIILMFCECLGMGGTMLLNQDFPHFFDRILPPAPPRAPTRTGWCFHRKSDPRETTNLIGSSKGANAHRKLKTGLLNYLVETGRTEAHIRARETLDWREYPRLDESYLDDPAAELLYQEYPRYRLDEPRYTEQPSA